MLTTLKSVITEHLVYTNGGGLPSERKLLNRYLQLLEISLLSKYNIKESIKYHMQENLISIVCMDAMSEVAKENAQKCLSQMLMEQDVVDSCI